jgi:CheY-like chemotaxis protein
MMEKLGWSVHISGTGNDAEESVKKYPDYDIILMDLQLPDQDGYETTKKIRSMGFIAPVIAVTAGTADMEKVARSGINSVLSKPLTLASLRQATQTALYRFSSNSVNL